MGLFLKKFTNMKVFLMTIAILALAEAHHDPRHIVDDGSESAGLSPEVILPTPAEEVETDSTGHGELEANVRHHIYMPLPLAYRQSATPPVVKYVPVYEQADPRFISYNAGANYNLQTSQVLATILP